MPGDIYTQRDLVMVEDIGESRRKQIRIRYPKHSGPTMVCNGISRHVAELSQEAIVVPVTRQYPLKEGTSIGAELRFSDGKSQRITGRVERLEQDEVLIKLDKPLSIERYDSELRWGSVLSDRRRFFRLRYPAKEILFLTVQNRQYRLTEISAHGIVYYCPEELTFHLSQTIQATLTFLDGEVITINGSVLRMTRSEVIVYLPVGIPEKRITREQQRLIRKQREEEERRKRLQSPDI